MDYAEAERRKVTESKRIEPLEGDSFIQDQAEIDGLASYPSERLAQWVNEMSVERISNTIRATQHVEREHYDRARRASNLRSELRAMLREVGAEDEPERMLADPGPAEARLAPRVGFVGYGS